MKKIIMFLVPFLLIACNGEYEGPYKAEVDAYKKHKEEVTKSYSAMKEISKQLLKNFADMENRKRFKRHCKSLPKPTYKFQDKAYGSQLDWCTAIYRLLAMEPSDPSLNSTLETIKAKELETMDNMYSWPKQSEFIKGFKKGLFLKTSLK